MAKIAEPWISTYKMHGISQTAKGIEASPLRRSHPSHQPDFPHYINSAEDFLFSLSSGKVLDSCSFQVRQRQFVFGTKFTLLPPDVYRMIDVLCLHYLGLNARSYAQLLRCVSVPLAPGVKSENIPMFTSRPKHDRRTS